MSDGLTVKDLTCARGGIPVLENVAFSLEAGNALSITGPNGIGKSTLLRCLVGLQAPVSGTINRDSDDFAYAGHADAIKATLSVAENLEFWAAVFGAPGIDTALTAFDLNALADRRAGELSAGQKRRLGLARMVLCARPIWVCDEPTVGLDVQNVERFAGAVKTHLATGGVAIMATHIDLGMEARQLDLSQFRASTAIFSASFDEAFL